MNEEFIPSSRIMCIMEKLYCTKCALEVWVFVAKPEDTNFICEACRLAPTEEIPTLPNNTPQEPEEIQEQKGEEPEQSAA